MTLEEPKLKLTPKAQEYKYLYRFTPIPFDTKTNQTIGGYKWKEYYKDGNLDEKIQKQWALLESFDKGGIAIILGKARDRDDFDETNVFAIDLEGESAVKAFCTREHGSVATLEELSQKFLLAWHDEDPTSIHIIGYSSKQLKNCTLITKPSPDKELREQIEVKADSILINMPPSLHKGGGQWTCIGEEKIPEDDRKGLIEAHLIDVFKRYGVDYNTEQSNYDPTSREQRVLSVIEMKKVKEGPIKGCGRVVAVGEQYQAVSQINAICNGMVPCACDASQDEHERRCNYKLHIDYTVENSRPPTPVILSIFDTGNGKPQVCPRCKGTNNFQVNLKYRRAKQIRLQDIDNRTDNARQDVILYDDMVEDLSYNEIVEVEGSMFVERKPGSSKTSMMDNILHATSIKYREDKKITITEEDKILFYRWKEICDMAYVREVEALDRFKRHAKQYDCVACHRLIEKITPLTFIERQSAAFIPNVIGHTPAKQGILRTLVGATRRGPNAELGKISTLLVGDKGTAKTKAARQSELIHPNSAHVTATHASGKAITGIVDAESKMLVLGILAASDVVVIDEIDKLPAEEQSRLLGVLEEQHFAKDAYGLHYEIDTNVSVIATANPTNTSWIDPHRVSKEEIGLIDTLKDRFTQIFTFRDDNDTIEKRKVFAAQFTAIRRRGPPNYTFFRKFWIYVTSLKPEISPDAERMLREFWASQSMGVIGLMDNRFLVHMFKISEAQAKLNLSEEVNEYIAEETQKAIEVMLLHYAENVKVPPIPSEITYNKFVEILENTKAGVSLDELCRLAINEDSQIATYLGPVHTQRDNIKLRRIVEKILKSGKVKKTHEKPVVLQWISVCDPCDPCDTEIEPLNFQKDTNLCEENNDFDTTMGQKVGSHISHRSHTIFIKCPHCRFENIHQDVIDHHVRLSHKTEAK